MASKNGTRLLAEWQKRLCLQDWTIRLYDEMEPEPYKEGEE